MTGVAVRAAVLIAAVYGTFLIFAQFAFVALLRAGGAGPAMERALLGAMAVTGILGGFLAAWGSPRVKSVRSALVAVGLSAALAPLAHHWMAWLAVAAVTGAALGVATVALSALVRGWCGVGWVGLGTGLGYACCNLPWVFNQSPEVQSWIGAGFAFTGALVIPRAGDWRAGAAAAPLRWWAAVAMFAALVWLDSAAFFIIQHVAELKAGSWGAGMCWRNALVHLLAALAAGQMLRRGGAGVVPVLAWALLAVAGLAANGRETLQLAGWLYPIGVSLYSTALIAWPAWFGGAQDPKQAGWRAAWLFALAGWVASANGIGMAQSLRVVPPGFVLAAGAVVLSAVLFSAKGSWRSALGPVLVLAAATAGTLKPAQPASLTAVERGRQVYLAEGCIHCHSQFLRPGRLDESLWGNAESTRNARAGVPVLIGNRRQGPDLATVGARRSTTWLREHFIAPAKFAPATSMPAYASLFRDGRGEDLIAYLQATANAAAGFNVAASADWTPAPDAAKPGPAAGAPMFAKWCVVCHGTSGKGDGELARKLTKPPMNLVNGPFLWTAGTDMLELKTARVIKFGIPGTDMPGHEVLTDEQLNALTAYVLSLRGGLKNGRDAFPKRPGE
ncbi:MAG: cbb3-type cytochrome c oxidase subunit II [Akkermansiaceae bacterium]|nr:cbb3-type cytochrome c oxidase subunit II [Akkermansiaceae bacterium]